MPKLLKHNESARRALESGVEQLARAVRITLGPKGRNVVLGQRLGGPTITNDGVTIAKEVELDDPWENLGATLVREVATKTNDVAGDGTTTATVLAHAMVVEGLRNLAAGANAVALKRGIEKAVKAAVASIRNEARDVDGERDIAHVAAISANNDPQIGDLVGEAIHRVGKDGVITVEESSTLGLELELVDGTRWDKGYVSPYFVTDHERMETVLDDPYILLSQQKISAARDLVPVLEKIMQTGKPVLVVADDIEGEALATLVVNKLRSSLQVVAVKAPGFGEKRKAMMQDLAVLTGGEVAADERGIKLENMKLEMLGRARRIRVTKDDTTIVEGKGDPEGISTLIDQIRAQMKDATSDWDREKLQERAAKLAGGVAVLKVGAATELELKEKKHRIEDSVSATRAALEEGVVAGGGSTLVRARAAIEDLDLEGDELAGARLVSKALRAPLWWISYNAGFEGGTVLERVAGGETGFGLNAVTGEFGDMFAAGVIDPARVARAALENAASVAAMFLTTDVAVVEKPEVEQEPSDGHHHSHVHPGTL